MITGMQARLTSSSATALSTTSGPIPAGSPMVMPMRGKTRLGRGPGLLGLSSECRIAGGDGVVVQGRKNQRARLNNFSGAGILNTLVGLVDVFDVPLQHQEIRSAFAIDLQRATIVPLDRAFDLFTIEQNDHHESVSIDLFLVIEDLGIGFTGRWNSFLHLDRHVLWLGCTSRTVVFVCGAGTPIRTLSGLRNLSGFALHFRECGSDEFTIHVIITSKNLGRAIHPSQSQSMYRHKGSINVLAGCGPSEERNVHYP